MRESMVSLLLVTLLASFVIGGTVEDQEPKRIELPEADVQEGDAEKVAPPSEHEEVEELIREFLNFGEEIAKESSNSSALSKVPKRFVVTEELKGVLTPVPSLEVLENYNCHTEALAYGHTEPIGILAHEFLCEIRKLYHFFIIAKENFESQLPLLAELHGQTSTPITSYKDISLETLVDILQGNSELYEPENLRLLSTLLRSNIPLDGMRMSLLSLRKNAYKIGLHVKNIFVETLYNSNRPGLENFQLWSNVREEGLKIEAMILNLLHLHFDITETDDTIPPLSPTILETILQRFENVALSIYDYIRLVQQLIKIGNDVQIAYRASGLGDILGPELRYVFSSFGTAVTTSFFRTAIPNLLSLTIHENLQDPLGTLRDLIASRYNLLEKVDIPQVPVVSDLVKSDLSQASLINFPQVLEQVVPAAQEVIDVENKISTIDSATGSSNFVPSYTVVPTRLRIPTVQETVKYKSLSETVPRRPNIIRTEEIQAKVDETFSRPRKPTYQTTLITRTEEPQAPVYQTSSVTRTEEVQQPVILKETVTSTDVVRPAVSQVSETSDTVTVIKTEEPQLPVQQTVLKTTEVIRPARPNVNLEETSIKTEVIEPARPNVNLEETSIKTEVIEPARPNVNVEETSVQTEVIQPARPIVNVEETSVQTEVIQPARPIVNVEKTSVQTEVDIQQAPVDVEQTISESSSTNYIPDSVSSSTTQTETVRVPYRIGIPVPVSTFPSRPVSTPISNPGNQKSKVGPTVYSKYPKGGTASQSSSFSYGPDSVSYSETETSASPSGTISESQSSSQTPGSSSSSRTLTSSSPTGTNSESESSSFIPGFVSSAIGRTNSQGSTNSNSGSIGYGPKLVSGNRFLNRPFGVQKATITTSDDLDKTVVQRNETVVSTVAGPLVDSLRAHLRKHFGIALPRDKVSRVLGRRLKPQDVVAISLGNGKVLFGQVMDSVSPIKFDFARPQSLITARRLGRVWTVHASEFDEECRSKLIEILRSNRI